ncbi:hypothetical protein [Solimonas terrae]|uniref:Uncharacterized protein n=1 Tax=Solimonas terrae TaxID=1396819 RepID=A0A6M2BLI9_9GAMM|nr:hypothetical protein [Solimonas terrae]NGY03526.1 hypothetical protein [Solimonas terrae]
MSGKFLALAALCVGIVISSAAFAGMPQPPQGTTRHMQGPPPNLDRMAMTNLIITALELRTGRSADEIKRIIGDRPPHEAADELGIDRETMKAICDQARSTLLDRAVQAQMITTEQAATLKSIPPPRPRSGTN